jgi:hypothetical protein
VVLLVDAVYDHPHKDDEVTQGMHANRHAQLDMQVLSASACTNSPTKKEFHTLVPCTRHACMHWLIQLHASTLPLQHEDALNKAPVLLALQRTVHMTMLIQWTMPCRKSADCCCQCTASAAQHACVHNTQPASCIGPVHGCTCTPHTLTSQIAYVMRWRKCAPCAGMAVVE